MSLPRPTFIAIAIAALATLAGCAVQETGLAGLSAVVPQDAAPPDLRRPRTAVTAADASAPSSPSPAGGDRGLADAAPGEDAETPPASADAARTPGDGGRTPAPADAEVAEAPTALVDAGTAHDAGPAADASVADTAPPDTAPRRALLITSADAPGPGDSAVRQRLGALGFRVTLAVVRGADAARAVRQMAAGVHLVYVSSSLDTGAAQGLSLADLAVPVICAEYAMFGDLRMLGGRYPGGGIEPRQRVALSPHPHPLRAGLSGTVTVTGAQRNFTFGMPLPSAQIVGTMPENPERALIFAYDKGAALSQGTAPARRVGLFAHVDAAAVLTTTGWTLFDAAVEWATAR